MLQSALGVSPGIQSAVLRLDGKRRHEKYAYTGYLSLPDADKANGAAVLVIMEIYGLNREVRRYTDSLAEQGYVALAPDLLWEHGDHRVFDYVDRPNALALVRSMGFETVADDIASAHAALVRLAGSPAKVGVVALGWGGKPALLARRDMPGCVQVLYYPGGLDGEDEWLLNSLGPTQFHLGELDDRTPPAFQKHLADIYRNVPNSEVQVYQGSGHGFANRDRKEYDAPAGALAAPRTLDYLAKQLLTVEA